MFQRPQTIDDEVAIEDNVFAWESQSIEYTLWADPEMIFGKLTILFFVRRIRRFRQSNRTVM